MARRRERERRMRTPREIQVATKRLRRELTPAEQKLWAVLRNRALGGLKFRIQHPAGPFVLDFYSPERKLVVEMDGAVHLQPDQVERDAMRTRQLNAFGYRVLRFRNEEVFNDLPSVLECIIAAANEPLPLGPPEPERDDEP